VVTALVAEITKAVEARERSPVVTSPQIHLLAEALAKAQSVMKTPAKDKHAKVATLKGGTYEYDYADLATVIDAVRQPFADNNLAIVQVPVAGRDGVGVITRILHASGQWIECTLTLPVADTRPQSIGSAITYSRRYSLAPMAGIASEADDDGNAAQGNDAETGKREPKGRGEADDVPPPEDAQAVERYNATDEQKETLRDIFKKYKVTKTEDMKRIALSVTGAPMADLDRRVKVEAARAGK
jgi:hypothetical protein